VWRQAKIPMKVACNGETSWRKAGVAASRKRRLSMVSSMAGVSEKLRLAVKLRSWLKRNEAAAG